MPGEEYEEEITQTPLLQTSPHKLTGNVWTALAHFIAGVIGSGVLSMAWSVAQLGWIAGPLSIILVAFFSLVSAFLISDIHLYSNPSNGTTIINRSYLQAVHTILVGDRAIRQSNCYHEEGHEADCEYKNEYYMLLFGIVQIVASQIPNIFHTKWLSIIAAAMSFTYSCIGIGLGLAQVIGQGKIEGSINGVSTTNPIDKVWLVAQAIGDISFSFTFSLILLEIQGTLKSPPPQKESMKKTSSIAVFITASVYICCGASGYAAFGDATPGNLLTGFGFYEPYWLVDFANACIVLHLIGGYQIFSQTLFAIVERWYAEKFPESIFTRDVGSLNILSLPEFRVNPLRQNQFRFSSVSDREPVFENILNSKNWGLTSKQELDFKI
ncbi:hypothetical protein L1887_42420 [Cichorium endivia]|nr:hypothetical protein L1887_42420 [Cichorium endivia]